MKRHMYFVLGISIANLCVSLCTANCSYKLPHSFKSACDVKDLTVTSRSGKTVVNNENCDSLVSKPEFATDPDVRYVDADKDKLYTVVMVDPDAPNHEEGKYFLHWIAANIHGVDLKDGTLGSHTIITSYYPPKPPKGTGKHRYIFLVFEQSGRAGASGYKQEFTTPEERRFFDLEKWIQDQDGVLCDLVSGIQFRTEF